MRLQGGFQRGLQRLWGSGPRNRSIACRAHRPHRLPLGKTGHERRSREAGKSGWREREDTHIRPILQIAPPARRRHGADAKHAPGRQPRDRRFAAVDDLRNEAGALAQAAGGFGHDRAAEAPQETGRAIALARRERGDHGDQRPGRGIVEEIVDQTRVAARDGRRGHGRGSGRGIDAPGLRKRRGGGFVQADVEMNRPPPVPARDGRIERGQFRGRRHIRAESRVAAEQDRLIDRLRSAGPATGARAVGGHEHKRQRLVQRLDGGREQFSRRRARRGDHGDRRIERQNPAERKKRRAAFLGKTPQPQRGGGRQHGDQCGIARARAHDRFAHADPQQRGHRGPRKRHGGVDLSG